MKRCGSVNVEGVRCVRCTERGGVRCGNVNVWKRERGRGALWKCERGRGALCALWKRVCAVEA